MINTIYTHILMRSFWHCLIAFFIAVFAIPQMVSAQDKLEAVEAQTKISAETADYIIMEEGNGSYIVEIADPIEGVNRFILKINLGLDTLVIKPLTGIYRGLIPVKVRDRVFKAYSNLSEPKHMVNGALQGRADKAFTSFWRFAINSTFGIGGMFDVAKKIGLEKTPTDFNDTLRQYGIGRGIYLMVPVLGPHSSRDLASKFVDALFDPISYITEREIYYVSTGQLISTRDQYYDEIEALLYESLDPYSAVKSVYTQQNAD